MAMATARPTPRSASAADATMPNWLSCRERHGMDASTTTHSIRSTLTSASMRHVSSLMKPKKEEEDEELVAEAEEDEDEEIEKGCRRGGTSRLPAAA
jgi:hypothetical protein